MKTWFWWIHIEIKGRGTAKLACKLRQIVNLCPIKFFQNFLIKATTRQRGMEKLESYENYTSDTTLTL